MNIKPTEDINGTCSRGYIMAEYDDLVKVLGDPHFTGGDKVTAEWDYVTEHGVVFTIYDWKEDETPMYLYEWHIGGADYQAVDAVKALFPKHDVGVC